MKAHVYQRQEFITLLSITEEELAEWERLGLVRHLGRIDNQIPFYTEAHVNQARQIQQLQRLGYDLQAIQKIVRKVGLPAQGATGSARQVTDFLTVGELAEQAGVNARTIKYWEERGILQPDARSTGGFRLYSRVYVYLCNLIKDLQNFGYSLEEIKEISDLFRDFLAISEGAATYTREETRQRLELMQQRMASLQERISALKQGIKRWEDLLRKKGKEVSQLLSRFSDGSGKPGAESQRKSSETLR
ncbi:MAG: MerR family transcriptional regulator [candidate division KSB1 bacterium]|nr:MerR family transcriptional regulator [candidate division KSB1 bacterium]MDZ7393503.1 MerR family transcriptional regulator [candidate division KSB1 bacterium]